MTDFRWTDKKKGYSSMPLIDLRSDTITLPTPAMRKAMAEAELGDDVFGEDPTVRKLEELAARRMGKEAALLVASGTMGNLVCQMSHCGRGDEMILGDKSHIFYFEQGGSAAVGGIHSRTVPNQPDGTLLPDDIVSAIRTDDVHFPRTRLIVLENTHNLCGGSPLSPDYLRQVATIAAERGLRVHVDGARIFNAATALNVSPAELAAPADSISFCLSKGLAAPVGSVVCGSTEFIAGARRMRKVLGGGMRQSGIIAAAGIVALEQMVERLFEDHENARRLAKGLWGIKGLSVGDPGNVKTNIVYMELGAELPAPETARKLEEAGVRVLPAGPHRLRAVTHYGITKEDVDMALTAFRKIFQP
ncbi:MAG: low-specificity L-threonine aldolase [Deltaproteobacteria bacterium]|nr:low-specificity L-threonine aldolase [Deltaproteobacteria bacterium]